MLPKKNRLYKKKEFELVKSKGELIYGEDFGILRYFNTDDSTIKIGLVVSKKISSKAVVRNKVRRKLSEAIRVNLEILPAGCWMIFLAKKRILMTGTERLQQEIEQMIKEIKNEKNST